MLIAPIVHKTAKNDEQDSIKGDDPLIILIPHGDPQSVYVESEKYQSSNLYLPGHEP